MAHHLMPPAMQPNPVQRAIDGAGWLDRTIERISPAWGQRRLDARVRTAITRAYLAASPSDTWRPRRGTASANTDHQLDAATLRSKSRALIQNVEYIAAGMNARVALMVGTGIVPKWGGKQGAKLDTLLKAWMPQADADGVLDYHGLVALAARTMDADGEVLIRLRPRRPTDGLAIPLQLQVLEVDWLDTDRSTADGSRNPVIGGKEYDAMGRCVAYWLWDQHPGDIGLRQSLRRASKRVPAEGIIHLYAPTRPGQGRGFPRLAPVINRARDLQLLEDAELQRKNLESRLSVIASQDIQALDGNPSALAAGSLGELAGGGITNVGPGVNLTTVQPQAMPGFVEYCWYNIHLICAGAGFTFEQATGQLRDTNFSSARIGGLNQRREIEQLQWQVLVPMLCDRICIAAANAAAAAGLFGQAAMVNGLRRGTDYTLEHSTPKWDYVNPKDEVAADLDELAGGLTSFSEKLRRRGDDLAVRLPEMAQDISTMQATQVGPGVSLWDALVQLKTGAKPGAAAATNTTPPAA